MKQMQIKLPLVCQQIFFHYARRNSVEHISLGNNGGMNRIMEDHLERYKFASNYTKDKKVLDIACGEGYGTSILARNAKSILGIDITEDLISKTKKYCENTNIVEFIRSDALDFLNNKDDGYDVIVSFETVEHIVKYKTFLKLLAARLKPEGLLIISTPNIEFSIVFAGKVFNPYHVHEFYTDELCALLKNYFHTNPILYRQRPVSKRNLMFSAIKEFVFTKKSHIVVDKVDITGMDNIFLVFK